MNLSYTDRLKGKIHFEYIPLISRKDYAPLEITDQSVRLTEDFVKIIGINSFTSNKIISIQKRIKKVTPHHLKKRSRLTSY